MTKALYLGLLASLVSLQASALNIPRNAAAGSSTITTQPATATSASGDDGAAPWLIGELISAFEVLESDASLDSSSVFAKATSVAANTGLASSVLASASSKTGSSASVTNTKHALSSATTTPSRSADSTKSMHSTGTGRTTLMQSTRTVHTTQTTSSASLTAETTATTSSSTGIMSGPGFYPTPVCFNHDSQFDPERHFDSNGFSRNEAAAFFQHYADDPSLVTSLPNTNALTSLLIRGDDSSNANILLSTVLFNNATTFKWTPELWGTFFNNTVNNCEPTQGPGPDLQKFGGYMVLVDEDQNKLEAVLLPIT